MTFVGEHRRLRRTMIVAVHRMVVRPLEPWIAWLAAEIEQSQARARRVRRP